MSQQRTLFAIRLHALAGICALALVTSPVPAGDDGRPSLKLAADGASPTKSETSPPSRPALVLSRASRSLEEVSLQMEAMSTFTQTSRPGSALHDNLMYAEHSQAVEHTLRRATRRELKEYLMEVTAVDRLIERYKAKGMQTVGLDKLGGSRGAGGRGRFGFDFGVSHLRPQIGMDYEIGRRSFRFSVGGDGRVGVRFRDPHWGGNQVSLGYDGEDAYYLGWRVNGF